MEPILKQNICKFLALIKDRVGLFDLNKSIDKQIIQLEPDDLVEEEIDREYLPKIIEYLKANEVVNKEIILTDSQYNDTKIQDPFMYEGIDLYSKYNIILADDFYKNYKILQEKLDCDKCIKKNLKLNDIYAINKIEDKINILFSENNGLYKKGNEYNAYTISDTRKMYLNLLLKSKRPLSAIELWDSTHSTLKDKSTNTLTKDGKEKLISKEISEINILFLNNVLKLNKNKLNNSRKDIKYKLQKDLIINKNGYLINSTHYNILKID